MNEHAENSKPIPLERSPEGALRELMEKQIALSEKIFAQNKKIQRRLTWMAIGGYLRLALLLIPLILAAIYLPPLIESAVGEYGRLFGPDADGGGALIGEYLQLLR